MSRFCVRRKTEETLTTAQKKKNSPEAQRPRVVRGILWNDDDQLITTIIPRVIRGIMMIMTKLGILGKDHDLSGDRPWNLLKWWWLVSQTSLQIIKIVVVIFIHLLSSISKASTVPMKSGVIQCLSSNTWNRDIWGDGSTKILLWVGGWSSRLERDIRSRPIDRSVGPDFSCLFL